ncbi:MAG: hypothetical protein ACPGJS_04940 [Flammeovirgaceae bacterium]
MYLSIIFKNNYPYALGAYHFDEGKFPDPTHPGVVTIASGASTTRASTGEPILVDVPGMGAILISCLPDGAPEKYQTALLNPEGKAFKHAALIRFSGYELLCGFDSESWNATLSLDAYGTLKLEKMDAGSKCIEIKIPEIILNA